MQEASSHFPILPYACYNRSKFGECQITIKFTTSYFETKFRLLWKFFLQDGGWAGALQLQGNQCAGVRVRTRGRLPCLSVRHGKSSRKSGRLKRERKGGGGLHRNSSPPHPCPRRPLSAPAPVRETEWSNAKAEMGNSPSVSSAILPHMGHQPHGPGGERIYF